MQSLNISSLHHPEIQVIATKIPEVKHFSIFSINNTLTKLHSILVTHWFAHVVKIIPIILIPLTVIIIVRSIVTLYCRCWWSKYGCGMTSYILLRVGVITCTILFACDVMTICILTQYNILNS